MQAFKPVLKLVWFDIRASYFIFWSILLAVTIFNVILALSLPELRFGMSANFAVYAYMAAAGFLMIKETFPYSLGMSSTRYHYYWGLVLGFLGLAVAQAVSLLIYVLLFSSLTEWLGLADNFRIFSLRQVGLTDISWINMLIIDFTIGLLLLTLFSLAGAILYRFGWLILLIIGMVGIVLIMTPSFRAALEPLVEWVSVDLVLRLLILAGGVILFCLVCIKLVLRRATIEAGGKR